MCIIITCIIVPYPADPNNSTMNYLKKGRESDAAINTTLTLTQHTHTTHTHTHTGTTHTTHTHTTHTHTHTGTLTQHTLTLTQHTLTLTQAHSHNTHSHNTHSHNTHSHRHTHTTHTHTTHTHTHTGTTHILRAAGWAVEVFPNKGKVKLIIIFIATSRHRIVQSQVVNKCHRDWCMEGRRREGERQRDKLFVGVLFVCGGDTFSSVLTAKM